MTKSYIQSGSGITINEYVSASQTHIDANIATPAQITSGSNNNVLISASGLSQSDYGKRSVVIPINTTTALIGSETNYVRIPSTLNNWKLIGVAASCGVASTSGSPVFTVYRSSASSTTLVNLLSTNITIDQGEYDSTYATTAPVISASNVLYTGDKVWASSAGSALCGTGVNYASVSLTLQNQP